MRRSVVCGGRGVLAVAGALLLAGTGLAQTPTLTVNARLVVLDVVVADANGKPVEGLTQKDFQVFEDGKLQVIRSLESPAAHALPMATVAEGAAAVFDPASPAGFGSSPADVLILDQSNTHFADSSFARRELQEYLSKQPTLLPRPTTLFNIYDGHFIQEGQMTRDRDALLRALAKTRTQYAWKLEVNGKADLGPVERLDQSLRVLEQLAQTFVRIPGRKNLIWVGGGFPTVDLTKLDSEDAAEVKDGLQHVTDALLDAHVTLYAVDPTSSAAGMTEITDATQMMFVQAAGDAFSGGGDPFDANGDFNELSTVTGGRVIRARNDVAAQIGLAVEAGAQFYTVAYSPASTSEKAVAYRKIKVVCLRPGTTVSTRTGYYTGASGQEATTRSAAYDLTTAAESMLPLNGLHVSVGEDMSINAAPFTYVVRVGVADLNWKAKEDGTSVASVYILAASLSGKRKMLGHTVHGMKATAKPGTDLHSATRTAEFLFTAVPTEKASYLRFVVRDSASGRMGLVDLPLEKR